MNRLTLVLLLLGIWIGVSWAQQQVNQNNNIAEVVTHLANKSGDAELKSQAKLYAMGGYASMSPMKAWGIWKDLRNSMFNAVVAELDETNADDAMKQKDRLLGILDELMAATIIGATQKIDETKELQKHLPTDPAAMERELDEIASQFSEGGDEEDRPMIFAMVEVTVGVAWARLDTQRSKEFFLQVIENARKTEEGRAILLYPLMMGGLLGEDLTQEAREALDEAGADLDEEEKQEFEDTLRTGDLLREMLRLGLTSTGAATTVEEMAMSSIKLGELTYKPENEGAVKEVGTLATEMAKGRIISCIGAISTVELLNIYKQHETARAVLQLVLEREGDEREEAELRALALVMTYRTPGIDLSAALEGELRRAVEHKDAMGDTRGDRIRLILYRLACFGTRLTSQQVKIVEDALKEWNDAGEPLLLELLARIAPADEKDRIGKAADEGIQGLLQEEGANGVQVAGVLVVQVATFDPKKAKGYVDKMFEAMKDWDESSRYSLLLEVMGALKTNMGPVAELKLPM